MIEIKNKAECSGCGACRAACPKKCITMQLDEEGFLYPVVDKAQCVNCGICENVCPFQNSEKANVLETYGFNAKEDELRKNSSSGGVFSLLAEDVISRDGIVYGIVLTEDCQKAIYAEASTKEELAKLRGSKYVQAETGDVYASVQQHLKAGQEVLFTGTPCQVNGLKKYLRRDYENLICMDIICHGAPSQKIWQSALRAVEEKNGFEISSVNFRNKKNGWKAFGICYTDTKGEARFVSRGDDPYMFMFLDDCCLRPSCYACKAKQANMADLTIGDLWGVQEIVPSLNDDKGTSSVIIRTDKGAKIFNAIKQKGLCEAVSYDAVAEKNPAEYKSVARPSRREHFYEDLERQNFQWMIKKYCREPFGERCKDWIKRSFVWKIYKKIKN